MNAEEIIAKVEERELIENYKELIFQNYLNCPKNDIKELLAIKVKINKSLVTLSEVEFITLNQRQTLIKYNSDIYKIIKNVYF